jgi:SAM-dependent methyltransferase
MEPRALVAQMLAGEQATAALVAMARLELADHLNAPATVEELAASTSADPERLGRLVRALATLGLLAESGGRYSLTAAGALLRAGVPGSLHEHALLAGDAWRAPWRALDRVVRAEPLARGPLYRYLADHPAEARRFHAVQAAHWDGLDVAALIPLEGARSIVDLGGGFGGLLAQLLTAHPAARGTLLDAPEVAPGASEFLAARGLAGRVRVVAGDACVEVPPGGDLYLLAFVLHGLDDARALAALSACRRAIAPGARLVVIENLLAEAGPSFAALLDLEMLLAGEGGRERTLEEYRGLAGRAGFPRLDPIATTSSATVLATAANRR